MMSWAFSITPAPVPQECCLMLEAGVMSTARPAAKPRLVRRSHAVDRPQSCARQALLESCCWSFFGGGWRFARSGQCLRRSKCTRRTAQTGLRPRAARPKFIALASDAVRGAERSGFARVCGPGIGDVDGGRCAGLSPRSGNHNCCCSFRHVAKRHLLTGFFDGFDRLKSPCTPRATSFSHRPSDRQVPRFVESARLRVGQVGPRLAGRTGTTRPSGRAR